MSFALRCVCVSALGCACTAEEAAPLPPTPGPNTAMPAVCSGPTHGEAAVVVDVAAGDGTACALDSFGRVYCWGSNRDGEAGSRFYGNAVKPQRLYGLACVTDIAYHARTGCALQHGGQVWCWGENGGGDAGWSPAAGGWRAQPLTELKDVMRVGSSGALLANGSVWNWGSPVDFPGPIPQQVPELPPAVALPFSGWANCAIDSEGHVLCWGSNGAGQVTHPSSPGVFEPMVIKLPQPAVGVSVGVRGTNCARLEDGSVWCWGAAPLGEYDLVAVPPRAVAGIGDVVSISVSSFHACSVEVDGDVRCWGDGRSGEVGIPYDGIELEPVLVDGLPAAQRVACGPALSCALTKEREVFCWGSNGSGQLGQDITLTATHIPQRVEIPLEVP